MAVHARLRPGRRSGAGGGQPDLAREALLHYGYINYRLQRFILGGDAARFMNHNDSPNVAPRPAGDPYGVDVASRYIAPGEETSIDYSLFEERAPGR